MKDQSFISNAANKMIKLSYKDTSIYVGAINGIELNPMNLKTEI